MDMNTIKGCIGLEEGRIRKWKAKLMSLCLGMDKMPIDTAAAIVLIVREGNYDKIIQAIELYGHYTEACGRWTAWAMASAAEDGADIEGLNTGS